MERIKATGSVTNQSGLQLALHHTIWQLVSTIVISEVTTQEWILGLTGGGGGRVVGIWSRVPGAPRTY